MLVSTLDPMALRPCLLTGLPLALIIYLIFYRGQRVIYLPASENTILYFDDNKCNKFQFIVLPPCDRRLSKSDFEEKTYYSSVFDKPLKSGKNFLMYK